MWFYYRQINFILILVIICVKSDMYINEIQNKCYKSQQIQSCFQYKILRYINDFKINNYSLTNDDTVKIIKLSDNNRQIINETVIFDQARYYPVDTELIKFVKFFKRNFNRLLNTQGIAIDLPNGAQIITDGVIEGRKKKEKKMLLLPLLILMKVFKVKVLASLILIGVIFIKKMLVTAAIILPSVLASLKAHCKPQYIPYHADENHHYHHDYDHDIHEYELSGYGTDKSHWNRNLMKKVAWRKR